jgi:cell division septum initiation protein DivIVA
LALDRQDIEKRDFPISRRGYDPDVVDRHLRAIAQEVEQLQRSSATPTETLAVAASEQVRAIVEAAETSAGDIRRDAEQDARRIRQQADQDAERSRAEAGEQSREHVTKVSEATSVMLQRVDAMESELGALVESLRTGTNRLTADLALLQGNMGELRAAGTGAPQAGLADEEFEPEPAAEREEEYPTEEEPIAVEAVVEEDILVEAEPAPEPAAAAGGGEDASEGARLIALNMALNGTPREETDRYLAENFELDDREGLLDEVYARVG